jgi:nucleoside-diphosphate-sugar epimerase
LWAITGASGYLGRALRADLSVAGIPSRGLARAGAEIAADTRDSDAVRALVRGADVVVHLAAYVHRAARGRAARNECWSVNVDGTQAVIDAVAAESPSAFAIFVSTANVYGPSEAPLDEASPCRPATAYGQSKLEAEGRFLSAVRSGAIRGCVLRPAVIFGPGAPGNMARLAAMVCSGRVVQIAHGAARKSIVPVSTAVGAIRAVATAQAAVNGEVINVAGEPLRIAEIIDRLAAARGAAPRTISIPRWAATMARWGVSWIAPSLAASIETYATDAVLTGDKLARLTGFAPRESASAALAQMERPVESDRPSVQKLRV